MRINKSKSLRARRNIPMNIKVVLDSCGPCNLIKSLLEAQKCLMDHTGSTKLEVKCRIRYASCRYKLACSWDRILGIHCQIGQHIYTSVFCCDFFCVSKRFQVRVIGKSSKSFLQRFQRKPALQPIV